MVYTREINSVEALCWAPASLRITEGLQEADPHKLIEMFLRDGTLIVPEAVVSPLFAGTGKLLNLVVEKAALGSAGLMFRRLLDGYDCATTDGRFIATGASPQEALVNIGGAMEIDTNSDPASPNDEWRQIESMMLQEDFRALRRRHGLPVQEPLAANDPSDNDIVQLKLEIADLKKKLDEACEDRDRKRTAGQEALRRLEHSYRSAHDEAVNFIETIGAIARGLNPGKTQDELLRLPWHQTLDAVRALLFKEQTERERADAAEAKLAIEIERLAALCDIHNKMSAPRVQADTSLPARVVAYVTAHPGCSKEAILASIGGDAALVRAAMDLARQRGTLRIRSEGSGYYATTFPFASSK